jgi:dTDP-4-amino-4,6-dideoxygalactose transaminase
VAVHLFGQLADMPAVMAASGDVPVIEDTAHAPLSYLEGRMAGAFGVARFYSFASTKYWPAGGGGLIVLNEETLASPLETAVRSLLPASGPEEFRSLLLQGTKAAVFQRPLYGFCGKPLRRWAEKWALLEPALDRHSIRRPWAAVARRQVPRMSERVEQQRTNSWRLLTRLSERDDLVLPWERPRARCNYHLFPVLLKSGEERTRVLESMWSRFVDLSTIYSGVVQEARRFGYEGGCPVAESVAHRLVTLPNYAGLTGEEIDYVAEAFLSSLSVRRAPEVEPNLPAQVDLVP